MSTSAQRVEVGYYEGAIRRVAGKQHRKVWSWKGLAFAVSWRKTKVTKRSVRRASETEPYQPVRVMAMSPPPPAGPPTPGSGTATTTTSSLIIQMGPLDLMPPNTSDGSACPMRPTRRAARTSCPP